MKSGRPDSSTISAANGLDRREPEEEQPVRDLAQAITDGNAFTDADAVRVARAFLQQHEEEAE